MNIVRGLAIGAALLIASIASAHTVTFQVSLAGTKVVPPNGSAGTAAAVVQFNTHTGVYSIVGAMSGLEGTVLGVDLHGPGSQGQNAPSIVSMNLNGSLFNKSGTLSRAELDMLMAGLTYLDVHTSAHPDGEVRGQLIVPVEPSIVVEVHLHADDVVPPNRGVGHAHVHAVFHPEDEEIHFTGDIEALDGEPTEVHFHGPATADENGPVIAALTLDGTTISGTVKVSSQQAGWFTSGLTYLDIHTTQFPSGEVRGQIVPIVPPAPIPCPADISSDQVVGGADIAIVLGFWNTNDPLADINDDGFVDGADITEILGNWGDCPFEPGIAYEGVLADIPVTVDTIDGRMQVLASAELSLRLLAGPTPGLFFVEVDRASMLMPSFPVAPEGTGGVGLRQDQTNFGSISSGSVLAVPFEMQSHYWLIDELFPPSPTICTVDESSNGITVEELWHGELEGLVLEMGEVLTIDGELHLHVHTVESGAVATLALDIETTLARMDHHEPEECPEVHRTDLKSLCVQPIFVGTGPEDLEATGTSFEAMKAKCEETWSKCCIEFVWLAPKFIDDDGFRVLTAGAGEDPWVEWRALIAAEDAQGDNDCIEVFFVESFEDAEGTAHFSGDALTFAPGTRSAKIVIADDAIDGCSPDADGVLAHQVGHACGACNHPPGPGGNPPGKEGVAGTVMDPTGLPPPTCPGVNSTLVKSAQCAKMARGPLLKVKVPRTPCCLSPD